MQKQKENLFSEKFKLLNSQENTERILWTSSESSESESALNYERLSNLTNKARKRKRKHKKKVPKNISNLDVTIVDVPKDITDNFSALKCSKSVQKCDSRIEKKSPAFNIAFPPYTCKHENSSPILSSKTCDLQKRRCLPDQSPVLTTKYASPKNSAKIRKKLFRTGENYGQGIKTPNDAIESRTRSCSPIISTKKDNVQELQRRKNENFVTNSTKVSSTSLKSIHVNHSNYPKNTIAKLEENNQTNIKENQSIVITETPTNDSSKSDEYNLDDSLVMLKTNNHELVKRVKSYFDSHFSSEMTSQCSISESLTPKQSSKTSDEIEILNYITQINSVINSSPSVDEKSKSLSLEGSQSPEINVNSKKIRYKKDGLAYRLNSLLKKRMANISLWQHEKFMAENSNFVIPKGEHLAFRIQNVDFKYGCYLLQVVDLSDEIFLIFINNKYVQNSNIMADMILKLYAPYKCIDFKDECKLIINVCKFECVNFKP